MTVLVEAWRIANILLAGWALSWVLIVRTARKEGDDPFHGEWLANALGLLMVAVIVGSSANVYTHRVFTLGLPFTTAGLLCLVHARRLSIRSRNGSTSE